MRHFKMQAGTHSRKMNKKEEIVAMAYVIIEDWPHTMDIQWVSRVLGLTRHDTYRLFQNPAFPGQKENGKWQVDKADLERWIHQQKKNTEPSL